MYKDVWKKILAAVLSVCLVVVLIQLPDFTVQAEEGKTYFDYRHSGNGISSTVSSKRAAAIFQSGQSQGDEYIESASFDVFVSEGTDVSAVKATVSLYLNPEDNIPDSGTFVCSSEIYGLTEGTNSLSFNLEDAKAGVGETFSVVVSLEGEGVSFYADEGSDGGKTFSANDDGSWIDLVTAGQCANIAAQTSKIEPETEETGIIAAAAALFSDAEETMAPESTENTVSGEEEKLPEDETVEPGEDTASEGTEALLPESKGHDDTLTVPDTENTDKAEETSTAKDTTNVNNLSGEGPANGIDLFSLGSPAASSSTVLPNKDIQIPAGTTNTIRLNNPVSGETYNWTSGDDTIASVAAGVDGEAIITANGVGRTTINVEDASGTFSDACNVTVVKNLGADSVTITVKDTDITYDGNPKTPAIEVMDGTDLLTENTDYTVNYDNHTDAGDSAKVTISGINLYGGTKEQVFTISPKDVAGVDITWDPTYAAGFPWTGNPVDVSAGIIVTDTQRNVTLAEGTDYELVYPAGDDHTTEGNHTVIVRGLDNNYTGDKNVAYIIQADINSDLEIRMADGSTFIDEYTYTGYDVQPKIQVLYKGAVLKENTDYTVAYSDCMNVSTPGAPASLTVTAQGSYKGTNTVNYEIIPKNIAEHDNTISAVVITPDDLVAGRGTDSVTPVLPPFEAVYNGKDMVKDTDYEIDASTYQFLSGNDWSDATSVSVNINGINNFTGSRTLVYSIGSDLVTELGSINPIADQTYTGSNINPAITFANATSLQENIDYSVTYTNNVNAGVNTATVKVKGRNGHGGELSQTFTILPKDLGTLSASSFSYDTPVEYTPGSTGIETKLEVTYNGELLEEGEDYIAAYNHNLAVNPNAELTLTPGSNGNFTGTKVLYYEISRCNIKDNPNITISGINKSYIYTGKPIEPVPVVTYGNSITLQKGTDYDLVYSTNHTTKGTASVTVTGRNNYKGSVVIEYEITDIPIENVILDYQADGTDVAGYKGVYLALKKYTGSQIKLDSNLVLYKDKADQAAGTPLVQDKDYTLSYTNNSDVSTSAKLATVTVSGMGNYSGSKTFSFLIGRELDTLSIPAISPQTYTGEAIKISDLGIKDGWFKVLAENLDYKVDYEDNITIGQATVTVKGTEVPTVNGCYTGSISRTFTIEPRKLADAAVTVQIKDQPFKGAAVEIPAGEEDAEITAILTNPDTGNQKTLAFNTDYTILAGSYTDNTSKGTAYVVLEGNGNFEGQRQVEFEIVGKSIADSTINVTIAAGSGTNGAWPYAHGNVIEPNVKIEDTTAGYELVPNKDYQIKYTKNKNAGTAEIKITGQGNYSDSRTESFIIEPLSIGDSVKYTVSGLLAQYTYTGEEIKPVPTVSYMLNGANTKLKADDFTVSYKYNENVTVGGQMAEVTINGNGNYKDSQTVNFTITAKDIADSDIKIADIPSQASTGTKVCPAVNITYGNYTLTDKDFKAEYFDNIMNGTARVEITGTGNFTGTADTTFEICTPLDDSAFDITYLGDSSYIYTGEAIEPDVEVKSVSTGKKLTENIDYKLVYNNNTDACTSAYPASVTVEGIGNYAGDKKFEFLITKKNIADSDVTAALEKSSYEFTGLQITPKVDHVTYNGKQLLTGSAGNDYTIAYGTNLNAGAAAGTVVIDAANSKNYEGTKTLTFDIAVKSIGAGTSFATGFSMEDIPVQGETGTDVCPVPVVKYRISSTDIRTLGTPADFTLSYRANIAPGTAYVTITGCGNYSGSVTKTFRIGGNIDAAIVTGIDAGYDYAGTPICPKPTSVMLNGTPLIEGTDYKISYDKNDDVGEATLTISGIGKYGGSITKTFDIYGDIADAVVAAIDDVPYTGSPVYPLPAVTWKGRNLVKDTDYTLAYEKNTDVGTAKITISGAGFFRLDSTQEVTFKIVSADGIFVISDIADQNYCGKELTPAVSVTCDGKVLTKDTDYTVKYSNNINAGTATVLVEGINGYASVGDAVKTFTIYQLSVGNMVLEDTLNTGGTGGIAAREYTGREIIPNISLHYQEGGKTIYTLTGSDYIMKCEENTDVGTAIVTITGSGINCTGTRTEYFAITSRDIDNVTVSGISNYTYTGSEITPVVTLYNGTIPMVEGIDYQKSFEHNINAGKAVVHLLGTGNYTGDRDVTFTISKMDLGSTNVSIKDIPVQSYTGEEIKPDVTVIYKDVNGAEHELDPATDYKVSYSGDLINKGNTARVLVEGQGTNFTGRKSTTFTIAELDINSDEIVVEKIPNQAYTGGAITPGVTIKLGNYTLISGTDYTLSYEHNTDLGTATVKIAGKGNFTGNRDTTFEIANGIDNAQITAGLETNYTYTGSPVEPVNLTVQIGSTSLAENTDYTISYKDNTDAGEASLILTGEGIYGGAKTFTFNIDRKKITDSDIVMTGFADSASYTGAPVTQNVVLTYGDITLTENTDYVVKYYNNTAIGTARMEIIGLDKNYEGTITKDFTIGSKLLSDDDVQVTKVSSVYTYSGEAIEPEPVVELGGTALTKGTDYKVSYERNTDAGIGTVILTGAGNYGGERRIDFNIVRKSIMLCSFGGVEEQIYTGSDVKPGIAVSDAGKPLTVGKDYTLTYMNNRKAGTGSIVVAGKDNYTVTKNIKFRIVPGGVNAVAVNASSSSSIGLSWSADGVVTGYEIYREGSDNRFTRVARTRNLNYNDGRLTGGTTYKYKVRAYLVMDNETYYSAFSDIVTGSTN